MRQQQKAMASYPLPAEVLQEVKTKEKIDIVREPVSG
jgi:hypothetical protein